MAEGRIFEGTTTNEAIENGLKALGIRREDAEIKVLESEDKRSFFSILAPRIVKVEIRSKEEKRHEKEKRNEEDLKNIDFNKAIRNVEEFLKEWINTIPGENIEYNVVQSDFYVKVEINGDDLNYLIGHRGETLNNLQSIISCIASKGSEYKLSLIHI